MRRALSHYGVALESPGRELENALLRIQKAHERASEPMGPVLGILERRLASETPALDERGPETRRLLDRLTELGRELHAPLADLASELRYQRFDQPLFESARAAAYVQAEKDLAALATARNAEREAVIARLVACAQPLATLLVERMASAASQLRPRLVETLLRRYYRIAPLGPVTARVEDGVSCAITEYASEGRRIRLHACFAPASEVAAAARALARIAAEAPPEVELALELYLWSPVPSGAVDERVEQVRTALAGAGFARPRPPGGGGGGGAGTRAGTPVEPGALHLPRRSGRLHRGPALPRRPPDVLPAHAAGAPLQVRPRAAALRRGRLPVPGRGPRQPQGRAALRGGGGPRPHPGARRGRTRGPAPAPGADAARGAGRHAPLPGAPLARPAPGVEPGAAHRRAAAAPVARGDPQPRRAARPGDRGAGARGGAHRRAGTRSVHRRAAQHAPPRPHHRERGIDPLRRPHRPAPGAPGASTSSGSSSSGAADSPTRSSWCGCWPRRRTPRPASRRASSRSTTSTPPGALVPVQRPPGKNSRQHGGGGGEELHRPLPGGHEAGGAARRPEPRHGLARRAGVPAHHGGPRPGRAAEGPAGVVRGLRRRQDLHGERHREHGLDLPGAAPDHRVHAARRRDQRGGHRHQRRRPALLERRGHHAHAHPGHPGHVPGLGHGAHRQGGPGLLGQRLGRGQPGHRRLRPDHGAQRPGPVPRRQPGRGAADPAPPLRPHLRGPRRALPAPRRHPRPDRPRRPRLRRTAPPAAPGSRRWATSSARRRTPIARSPSTSAG